MGYNSHAVRTIHTVHDRDVKGGNIRCEMGVLLCVAAISEHTQHNKLVEYYTEYASVVSRTAFTGLGIKVCASVLAQYLPQEEIAGLAPRWSTHRMYCTCVQRHDGYS